MQPIKVKFAHEIGTRMYLRIYWGDSCKYRGCHNAMKHLKDELHPLTLGTRSHRGGNPEDYPEEMWPTQCEDCGMLVPRDGTELNKQVFNQRLYDTPSGRPEVGSLFYAHWISKNAYWDNKEDFHLICVCPDPEYPRGWDWVVDGRAANCDKKEDRLHRCWVRHGDPETGNLHVDKNGLTCNAGAGSIMTKNWHGFLHHGFLTT